MEDRRKQQIERRRQERIKRAKRKNIIIYVETLVIIILVVALVVVGSSYVRLKNQMNSNSSTINSSSVDSILPNESSNSASEQQALIEAELNKWYMLLVNPDNSVSKDFIENVERSEIASKYTNGNESGKYLDSRIVDAFENMCSTAEKDDIRLVSVSAYRSYNYQLGLYNRRVERCQNEEGLSLEAAKKKAATIVALPGTSEHHLGLAVDINSVEVSFEDTKAFRWLQENAADYGFILRYPKDKQSITKIIYEPWHYRYVGVEHATAMNELDMCMEEYIEYLKSGASQNN